MTSLVKGKVNEMHETDSGIIALYGRKYKFEAPNNNYQ
jgi:hypothetical protein